MDIKTGLHLLETNKMDLQTAIKSSHDPSELINRYILRNPGITHSEYSKYYKYMKDKTKVILFKYMNMQIMILEESKNNKDLQQSLLNTYFVDEDPLLNKYHSLENHTIENILKNFDIDLLSNFFSNQFEKCLENSVEYDDFLLKYIQKLIEFRGTDYGASFSNAINKRLTCNNVIYFQKGEHLINLFTNTKPNDENQPKKDDISVVNSINFELDTYETLHAQLPEKYQHFKPHAIETCIEKIVKNKNTILTKLCFIYFYKLIPSTTKRSLRRNSTRFFKIILDFNDDKIEQMNYVKIKLISQLMKYDFDDLMKYSVDVFYNVSMVKKHILIAVYKGCINFMEYYEVNLLVKLLMFNYKDVNDKSVKNEMVRFLVEVQCKYGLNGDLVVSCAKFIEKIHE